MSHLTLSERRIIAGMLQRKISEAQIAIQIGRHAQMPPRIRNNLPHADA